MASADRTALGQARVGETLAGKWCLENLIGIGGMGAVYAARHRNGKRCALKVLHREHANNPEVCRRFLDEGYIANSIDHPNVVQVDDDDRDLEGTPFLVMELLEGESLDRLLAGSEGSMDEGLVVDWMSQLLLVLEAAHSKGIVHRDLKPENIFLTNEGVIKVLDFGVARAQQLLRASTLTKDGDLMGTPAFMAPEQALGLWGDVDSRTDIWAVGATLFYLLSGQPVHVGRTPNEQLAKAMTCSARALTTVTPQVSPEVAAVVDLALRFERAERWQNAASMRQALEDAKRPTSGKFVTTMPRQAGPPVPVSARPRSKWARYVGLVGIATGLGLALFFARASTTALQPASLREPTRKRDAGVLAHPLQAPSTAPAPSGSTMQPRERLPIKRDTPTGLAAPVSAGRLPRTARNSPGQRHPPSALVDPLDIRK